MTVKGKTLEIKFRKLSHSEWGKGLLATLFFALLLAAIAALMPFSTKYQSSIERYRFYLQHPVIYFLLAASALTLTIYRYGPMVFSWIPHSLTKKPACLLDQDKISCWTDTGQQVILWQDVTNISLRRPQPTEPRRFFVITIENNGYVPREGYCAKIVLDSDRMDFEPRQVIQFIGSLRPELTNNLTTSS